VSNRTGNYEVWTVSVESAGFGKGFKRLTKTAADESTPSWWAPSKPVAGSGRIAYARSGNIWVMKDSGSGQKELTSGIGVDWAPEWSSDGKLIAYESDENADPYSKNIYETWTDLWTVDLKGTTTQLMETSDVAEGHPTWVPGAGKRLLFDLAKDWGPHPKHVWVGIFNGSVFTVTKQLTFGAGYLPGDFNPDWRTLP
jgi:Tol biopolymer transport system component